MKHASRLSGTVLAVCFFLTASIMQLSAQQNSAGTAKKAAGAKVIIAEGIGSGETRQDALHDAMRKAIEIAVGTYILTETVSVNNSLLKNQILVASDAVVTNYTELDCVEHNGMWMIKIKAKVLPNEYLKYCPKQITDSVSATEIGNIINKRNAAKDTEKMFQEIAEDYLPDILKFKKESISMSSNGDIEDDVIPLSVSFSGKLDQYQFERFLNRLSSVLDIVALQKTKIEIQKDSKGRFGEIPENIAETLWKKAGLTQIDKEKNSFIAFRNYKNGKLLYSLYLVPQNVRRALAQAVKVKDVFGNETGQHYIVLSISYANTQETEKVFFKFDQIGIAYYDRSFPMMGLRVYESFFSPLTFSNIFSFKPESFGKVKVTRKSNVSVAGTMELSLPADSVKDMKKVFIYPLVWDRDLSTYWTPESRDKAEQACDRIESKYWNSNR